jgi:aspartate 1-decarboxylase
MIPMILNMLKAKIHRATTTHAELDYEGSCAIDEKLLEASGILEYEQIHIYNVANGERFVTYAIRAESGSGIISVNGAAAHKASPGDLLIICAYGQVDAAEAAAHRPRLVYPDADNRIARIAGEIPAQAA